jgi:Ser/Thr protein kinase RdoA (MazF antagonist)
MKKVSRSTMSSAYIGSFLCQQYGFASADTVLLHRGFNDTYRIHAKSVTLIFRLYRADWRSKDEILAEVEILRHLHSRGRNVTPPVVTQTGDFLTQVDCPEGCRFGVLFELAPGNIPDSIDNGAAKNLGALLATIHNDLDSLSQRVHRFELDREWLVETPFRTLETTFPHWSKDLEELNGRALKIAARLSSLPSTAPDFGLIHGDFVSVNVHKSGSLFTIIDWDFCGYGWRAYDLAAFAWGLRCAGQDSFPEFLAAYRSEVNLSDQSISAIPAFEAFRELWVWAINVAEGDDFRRLNDHQVSDKVQRLRSSLARAT